MKPETLNIKEMIEELNNYAVILIKEIYII
jgi:hypothetical protein